MPHPCDCLTLERDKGDRCGTCRFGVCPCCTYPNAIECHRRAPTANEMTARAVWPEVERSYWCGDYEPRPRTDDREPLRRG